MPNIQNEVKVNILLGSVQAQQATFDTALILSKTATARLAVYGSLEAVGADYADNTPEFLAAELYFGQAIQPNQLLIGAQQMGDADAVAALTAIRAINDTWYGLIYLDHTAADVLLVAAYIEANNKVFGTSSSDATILTNGNTDIAYQLKALNYVRTFVLYSAAAASFPETGWIGGMFALSDVAGIGSVNWKYKQIVGIAADNLTDTQLSFAEGKNCNVYIPIAGVDITSQGYMVGGQFIDLTIGKDALQSQMQTDIFNLFVSKPKIAYDNKGINLIENVVTQDLQDFVDNGFLVDKSYSVHFPDAALIPGSTKQTRVLSGGTFTAEVAGAINKTIINGTLSF